MKHFQQIWLVRVSYIWDVTPLGLCHLCICSFTFWHNLKISRCDK